MNKTNTKSNLMKQINSQNKLAIILHIFYNKSLVLWETILQGFFPSNPDGPPYFEISRRSIPLSPNNITGGSAPISLASKTSEAKKMADFDDI